MGRYLNSIAPYENYRAIAKELYFVDKSEIMGEECRYTGRILAVGISYNRETKAHSCMVEVL